MKKLLFALVGLSMLTFGAANAQYKMTIHKTDNTTVEIDLNDISEVTFDQTEVAFEYEAVDLGLESGTLWASCNVGAQKPEDYGYYIAWGETAPHEEGVAYTEDDYSDYYFDMMPSTIAGTEYDAAKAIMGEGWTMPTNAQAIELAFTCTVTWEEVNGVFGARFVGPNGNSIFIPAAGRKQESAVANEVGTNGFVWIDAMFRSNPEGAYIMWFGESPENGSVMIAAGDGSDKEHPLIAAPRVTGLSVRGVKTVK